MVGFGPFRFLADERVPGARAVYARNERYVPVPNGTPSGTAGPKIVNLDRVEWLTTPDPATAASALQAGRWIGGTSPRPTCCRCCGETVI
jgi:peptide/nickel transport system substrate-binding protein